MKTQPAVPLDQAVLCMDCNTISTSRGHTCGVCGSRAIGCLLRMLDGPVPVPAFAVQPELVR